MKVNFLRSSAGRGTGGGRAGNGNGIPGNGNGIPGNGNGCIGDSKRAGAKGGSPIGGSNH